MPIIEIPNSTDPLSQGDILKDIPLFTTLFSSPESTGETSAHKTNICLVLSRPCAAIRRPHIVVAGISRDTQQYPSEINTFKRAIKYITDLRDGINSPDVFFLGQLPNENARFNARFDHLFNIQIPVEDKQRAEFVAKHRFAKLNPEFQRSLHSRLFQAFCILGFEDFEWLPDRELESCIDIGKAEIAKSEAEILGLQAIINPDDPAKNKIKSLTTAIAETKKNMVPYEAELIKRKPTD